MGKKKAMGTMGMGYAFRNGDGLGSVGKTDATRAQDRTMSLAQELLEEVARKSDAARSNPPATTRGISMRKILPSTETIEKLVKPIIKPALWLWDNGEKARLEQVKREWKEEIKRAEERLASRQAATQRMEFSKPIAKHKSVTASYTTAIVDSGSARQTASSTKQYVSNEQDPTAGSIWSNSKVAPVPYSAARLFSGPDILPQFVPTLSLPANTSQPQEFSHDPYFSIDADAQHEITSNDFSFGSDVECSLNVEYGKAREPSSSSASDYSEEQTFSEGSKSRSSMSTQSSTKIKGSASNIDLNAPDSNGMLLYGRWKHHKDAPLSHLKDMISRDMRGNDSCSIFGSGMMSIEDHPVLPIYRARLKAEHKEDSDIPPEPPLSPILMSGRNASHRTLLRCAAPVSFTMEAGTFKTTGFQIRTASMGSTIDSAIDVLSDLEASGSKTRKCTTAVNPTIRITPPSLPSPYFGSPVREPEEPLRTAHFERKLIPVNGVYYPVPKHNMDTNSENDIPDVTVPRKIPEPMIHERYVVEFCRDRNVTIVDAEDADNAFWETDEEEEDDDDTTKATNLGSKMPIKCAPNMISYNQIGERQVSLPTSTDGQMNPDLETYRQIQLKAFGKRMPDKQEFYSFSPSARSQPMAIPARRSYLGVV